MSRLLPFYGYLRMPDSDGEVVTFLSRDDARDYEHGDYTPEGYFVDRLSAVKAVREGQEAEPPYKLYIEGGDLRREWLTRSEIRSLVFGRVVDMLTEAGIPEIEGPRRDRNVIERLRTLIKHRDALDRCLREHERLWREEGYDTAAQDFQRARETSRAG